MALSIGELTGYLDLDAGPFEKAINSAFDKLGDKKWQVVGAAAGVAAGTAMAAGLVMSMDAEKGNAKVAAQLDLTKEQAATAGKAAGALFANNYGSSMEDVQGAVSSVMSSIDGMKDASSADVEDITKKVLNLASAFEIDTGRAAQVAGQMVKSGLVDNATEALDLLTGTLQKVPQNVREDIMDAVDEYGPFFQQLGIKGSDAMGLLAKASEKGMYGIDKVGDSLKEFTIRATDGSKSTEGAMESIGLNAHDMALQILAGGKTASSAMGEIINGLTSMDDPAAQAQAALALFGTPLEDLGTDQIPNFLNSIDPMGDAFDSLKGKADEMDATLNGGATNSLESLKRAAQGALMDTMKAAIPYLMPVIDFLKQFAPQIGPAVLVLGTLAGAIWAVTAATAAWTAVAALNPASLWIMGIMALIAVIALLVANWDTVVKFLTDVWNGFVGWFQGVMGGFLSWWDGVWSGFLGFLTDAWNGIVSAVSGAWGSVVAWVTGAVNGFLAWWNGTWEGVGQFFSDAWNGLVAVVTTAWNAVVAWVNGAVGGFLSWWGGVWAALSKVVSDYLAIIGIYLSTGWEIIQTIVATFLAVLIAIFTGKWDEIGGLFQSALVKIAGFVMGAWNALTAITSQYWDAIVAFFVSIWNNLVNLVVAGAQAIWNFLVSTWDGIVNGTINAWNGLMGFFADTWNNIVQGFITLGVNIVRFLSDTWNNVTNTVTNTWNNLVSFVTSIPGRFMAGLAALGNLAGMIGGWVAGAYNAAVNKFNELVGWVTGLPGRISSALGNLGGLLVNAGNQIMEGFLNGLQAAFKGVQDFVGGIGQWIADHKGPKAYDLALLVPAGGWIMDGLQAGIRRSMPSLKKTLGDVSTTIASGVTGGSVGLAGTASTPVAAGAFGGGNSYTYAPTLYGGPDPEEQERKARLRFNDMLHTYK